MSKEVSSKSEAPIVRKPQLQRRLCLLLDKMGTIEVIVRGADDDGRRFIVSLSETEERELYDQKKPRSQ